MGKLLKIVLPLLVLGILGVLGFKIISKVHHKKQIERTIKTLPDYSFLTLDGQAFGNTDLQPGMPKIFVYFNSTCEYCQDETKQFQQQLEKFKEAQLLFISTEEPQTIKTFAQHYKLTAHDNVHFLYDPQADFTTLFGANSIPYILIYNANDQLVYKHKGAVKVENLLKELEQ